MTHIIGIFNIVTVFQEQEKKKSRGKTQVNWTSRAQGAQGGWAKCRSHQTMQCTSKVQVLAINVAKNIYTLCLLLSERWATYLASQADICMAKTQIDGTEQMGNM